LKGVVPAQAKPFSGSGELNALPCCAILSLRTREVRNGETMASDSIDDYIASVARALGLTIEDAWRPAVRSNLEVSLRMARLVDEFPLPDESEPASIFSA
jgi:hypothetical protein